MEGPFKYVEIKHGFITFKMASNIIKLSYTFPIKPVLVLPPWENEGCFISCHHYTKWQFNRATPCKTRPCLRLT